MAALSRRDAAAFATLLAEHSRKTGEVVCAALRAITPSGTGTFVRSRRKTLT